MTGLYIHIPFCVKKCSYCDFNSYSNCENLFDSYFKCLKKEIIRVREEGVVFDTVYIGGGTPTFPPNHYLTDLIKYIDNITADCEITVECNPKTVSPEDLENLRKAGANRLSIGMQSADDDELKALGRVHNFADFEECFKWARKAGLDNISIDVMFGLPDQSMKSFRKTLEKAVEFNSEHISCYCLKIEEGTPFAKMSLNLPSDDMTADMYELCADFLEKNGYYRYEISNFSKKGKESKHNRKYWLLEEYIGIGAGAHSYYKGKRYSEKTNILEYINAISSGEDALSDMVFVSEKDKMSEFVFLGLRMTEGIDEERFKELFGKSIYDVFGNEIEKYINLNVMAKENGRIFIKKEYLYVSNNILADFI